MERSSNQNKRNIDAGGIVKEFYSVTEVEETNCLFCESKNFTQIAKERGNLGVVKCNQCSLIYTNPRQKEPERVYWGEEEAYFREARLIFEGKAEHHRDKNYLHEIKLIEKYKNSGRVLDVGPGMGFFLRLFDKKKWETEGVEPSPTLSALGRTYFGLNITNSFLEEFKTENKFDVITLIDVFEHISSPKSILKKIQSLLKEEGIVLVKVPNGTFSLFKQKLGAKFFKNLDIWDSYEHVVHYDQKTVRNMLESNNFKILTMQPAPAINLPGWENYVGAYFQYKSPFFIEIKQKILRNLFYISSKAYYLLTGKILFLSQNMYIVAKK